MLITIMILSGLRFMGKWGCERCVMTTLSKMRTNCALALVFLGFGPQKDIKIQLPNYMTKERYDRAYLDLTAQCPKFPADIKMHTRPIRTKY